MHTAGRGLTGDGADDVARCGAVLVGPADAAVAPCGEWWARLLVGAAFRHLCAVGGGRLPEEGVLPAFVRRPAPALLADLAASPDDGAAGGVSHAVAIPRVPVARVGGRGRGGGAGEGRIKGCAAPAVFLAAARAQHRTDAPAGRQHLCHIGRFARCGAGATPHTAPRQHPPQAGSAGGRRGA